MEKVAFLFDNDGVLIDSSAFHWTAWQDLMEQEAALRFDHEAFLGTFGKRNDLILKELVPDASEHSRLEWARQKESLFRERAFNAITLLPGIEAFLKQLQHAKIPRIIASSTPVENLRMYLSSTVLGKYFDQFVSGEEVAHGKPAPDVFLAAAQQIGFEPNSCIVVEDAPAGIQAGIAAGCFVIALATTHAQEELEGYHLLYPSAADLHLESVLDHFKKWKKQCP